MIIACMAHRLPDEGNTIVYIPEGVNNITPTVNGKPKNVTVRVLPAKGGVITDRLQKDLEKLQAQNVRPIFDFDHKDTGPASAIPEKFRYEEGKGVVVDVEWTGRSNLNNPSSECSSLR